VGEEEIMKCADCGRRIAGGIKFEGRDVCFGCMKEANRKRELQQWQELLQAERELNKKLQQSTHCALCGKEFNGDKSSTPLEDKIVCWRCFRANMWQRPEQPSFAPKPDVIEIKEYPDLFEPVKGRGETL
jgi:DNA-directed RNA polymerase subunit RPC12/RpoP